MLVRVCLLCCFYTASCSVVSKDCWNEGVVDVWSTCIEKWADWSTNLTMRSAGLRSDFASAVFTWRAAGFLKKRLVDAGNVLCSFIHSVFCLTTGPKPPPKRFLHTVRSRASSFKWKYHLLPLRLSSSFLRLLPRLLATSISPFIFPSITCFRRQFLRQMWPIQLAFRFLISCTIFLSSLTLSIVLRIS